MSKKRQENSGTGDYSGRRKKWADSDMVSAMRAVKMGQLTISAAAIKFSVPRKTLDDRIKGRIKHGSKPGVSTALSSIEEDSLVSHIYGEPRLSLNTHHGKGLCLVNCQEMWNVQ